MTDRELLQQALKELEGHETIFKERNINKVIEAIRTRLAEPEKEWVGLTEDERLEAIWESGEDGLTGDRFDVARAIEAKLKEKNT